MFFTGIGEGAQITAIWAHTRRDTTTLLGSLTSGAWVG